jgi:hypothetical protein
MRDTLRNAAILGVLQFFNWAFSMISWRAVAQANIPASICVDATLASFQFFVFRRLAKDTGNDLTLWLGYTIGGVLGTVTGVYSSIWLLGR